MKIRITPGAALLFCALLLCNDLLLRAAIPAALFHELGHIAAARLLGIRLRRIEVDIGGARLFPASTIASYRAELLLAAAGPAASLLLAPFTLADTPFCRALFLATLSLALFNLFPIHGFDGGRILFSLLAPPLGIERARAVLGVTTYLSLLLLFALSACLLLRYGERLSLAVLSATLFARQLMPERDVT